ncbi:hypothetical protein [Desulfobacter curvatus]|uniref:hypothetical protein n=1 Tax=Desulfobacter curvatus TaxID=2290 RepID=UPI0012F84DDB|nr:hypothetical protein [Desulfobacter curvatus]
MPKIKVIARGTLGNETSQQGNNRVSGIIGRELTAELQKTKPARLLDRKSSADRRFNALWRDGRTAMEIVDPVRFSYTTCPVRLETASGRKTALKIGREYNAKAVMIKEMILSSPRQPREIPRPGEIFFPDSNLSS